MELLLSFSKLRNLLLKMIVFVSMCFCFQIQSPAADPKQFQFTATVSSELQLTISGGNNEKGKRTLLMSDAIQFGKVSFVQPDLIATGDAYLKDGSLMLEAIIDVATIFNGTNQVNLSLSKSNESTNSFHDVYFSESKSRSQSLEKIQTSPAKNLVKTIRKSTDFPIRVVFEIAPEQKGDFYDRLKLEATSL